jgi:hypothetical protein
VSREASSCTVSQIVSAMVGAPHRAGLLPLGPTMARSLVLASHAMPVSALAAGGTMTWILSGRWNVVADHFLRSHKQRSTSTCNLSMEEPPSRRLTGQRLGLGRCLRHVVRVR